MVETKSRPCEGRFPKRYLDKWLQWNHPSRDPLRDPAALLTKEGSLHATFRIPTAPKCKLFRIGPSSMAIRLED